MYNFHHQFIIKDVALLLLPIHAPGKPEKYYKAAKVIVMKKNKTPHGAIPRGLEKVLSSRLRAGLFGRMFRHLPPLKKCLIIFY